MLVFRFWGLSPWTPLGVLSSQTPVIPPVSTEFLNTTLSWLFTTCCWVLYCRAKLARCGPGNGTDWSWGRGVENVWFFGGTMSTTWHYSRKV